MDYQLLRYIITVDKHQSISKAAEELYLTQPNISKAINFKHRGRGIHNTVFSKINWYYVIFFSVHMGHCLYGRNY